MEKMAKQYTCEACNETLTEDRESILVEKVQEHAKEEHNMEMEAKNIREDIKDT